MKPQALRPLPKPSHITGACVSQRAIWCKHAHLFDVLSMSSCLSRSEVAAASAASAARRKPSTEAASTDCTASGSRAERSSVPLERSSDLRWREGRQRRGLGAAGLGSRCRTDGLNMKVQALCA